MCDIIFLLENIELFQTDNIPQKRIRNEKMIDNEPIAVEQASTNISADDYNHNITPDQVSFSILSTELLLAIEIDSTERAYDLWMSKRSIICSFDRPNLCIFSNSWSDANTKEFRIS